VKPSNLMRLYRVRLRARFAQECFAVAGIAAGVALLFASQVSTASLQSSVAQLSRGIVGRATLQLSARDPTGFPEGTLQRVRRIPGVRLAAPLLEASAQASGPRGSQSVELVGADASLSALGGALVSRSSLAPFGGFGAIALPGPLARAIGVSRFGQEISFQLDGHSVSAPLYAQLHAGEIGALVSSPVAVAPLALAQEMTGLTGRVTRILIAPAPGAQGRVRSALMALAGGRLNVESSDYDEALFANAAAANDRSTDLFALVSALVGFLFAFNAVLFTVPQRRRLVAGLRRDGYTPRTVIAVLLADAVALGLIACALGLALGDELSIHVLRSNPAFLSLAFALGSERVVSVQSVAIAAGGGMLAAILAVLSPLRDVLSRDPLAAIAPPRSARSTRRDGWAALAGVACVAGAGALLRIDPGAGIASMVLLVAAVLLVLPLALSATLALLRRVAGAFTSTIPHVAAMELGAAGARAVAIAATGALAVFASVAVQGAHHDLLAGLEGAARATNASAEVWVAPAGYYDLLHTTPFPPGREAELSRLPGVRAVGLYRSGLLDYGARRVWVLAPPAGAAATLAEAQLTQGSARTTGERLRAGGWLVLSATIAAERHLRVGQAFTLPSPHPQRFRLAATSTNLSWAPGSIVMGAADYARAWGSQDISAYGVVLDPGISPTEGAREIEHALGPGSGLAVQTARARTAQQSALSRTALARLSQIATLILIVAVLTMAAAMAALLWQRRPRLAKLTLEGLRRGELWGTVLLESALLVGVGCVTGALFGLYGEQLADRALSRAVDFPVVYSVSVPAAVSSLALVCASALAILAIPGYLAARAPVALALRD
jgi:putative ABC transport system permease protein